MALIPFINPFLWINTNSHQNLEFLFVQSSVYKFINLFLYFILTKLNLSSSKLLENFANFYPYKIKKEETKTNIFKIVILVCFKSGFMTHNFIVWNYEKYQFKAWCGIRSEWWALTTSGCTGGWCSWKYLLASHLVKKYSWIIIATRRWAK